VFPQSPVSVSIVNRANGIRFSDHQFYRMTARSEDAKLRCPEVWISQRSPGSIASTLAYAKPSEERLRRALA
jgi:hypothetical protein